MHVFSNTAITLLARKATPTKKKEVSFFWLYYFYFIPIPNLIMYWFILNRIKCPIS